MRQPATLDLRPPSTSLLSSLLHPSSSPPNGCPGVHQLLLPPTSTTTNHEGDCSLSLSRSFSLSLFLYLSLGEVRLSGPSHSPYPYPYPRCLPNPHPHQPLAYPPLLSSIRCHPVHAPTLYLSRFPSPSFSRDFLTYVYLPLLRLAVWVHYRANFCAKLPMVLFVTYLPTYLRIYLAGYLTYPRRTRWSCKLRITEDVN